MKWIKWYTNKGTMDLMSDDGELLMGCETWGIDKETLDLIPQVHTMRDDIVHLNGILDEQSDIIDAQCKELVQRDNDMNFLLKAVRDLHAHLDGEFENHTETIERGNKLIEEVLAENKRLMEVLAGTPTGHKVIKIYTRIDK